MRASKHLKKNFNSIFAILLIVLLMFGSQYNTSINFDAAMNFQVSKNIVEKGIYATSYPETELFADRVQTGAPVIFLTAVLNMIFGINSNNMQLVTTFYATLFVCAIFFFMKRKCNFVIALLTCLSVLCVPSFLRTSYGGTGETSMGLFMFLTVIFFCSNHENKKDIILSRFVSGICLGLGYLTKTIMLIILPAFLVMIVLQKIKKQSKFRYDFFAFLGAVFPVSCFELYKLSQLKFDKYVIWWKNILIEILGQAGVTDKFSANDAKGIAKIREHIFSFCDIYNIPLGIMVFVLLTIIVTAFIYIIIKNMYDPELVFLTGITLTYFIWWSVMSPTEKLWPRRALLCMTFLIITFCISCYHILNMVFVKKEYISTIIIFFWGILYIVFSGKEVYVAHKGDVNLHRSELEASDYLRELPENCDLWGVEWYQNPTLSAMSGRHFRDISFEKVYGDDNYFVEDANLKYVGEYFINHRVLRQYNTEIVFDNGGATVYKLLGRKEWVQCDNGIKIEFADEPTLTASVFCAENNTDYSELERYFYYNFSEDIMCLEFDNDTYEKYMIQFQGGEEETIVKIKQLAVKKNGKEIVYEAQELYDAFIQNGFTANYIFVDDSDCLIISFYQMCRLTLN